MQPNWARSRLTLLELLVLEASRKALKSSRVNDKDTYIRKSYKTKSNSSRAEEMSWGHLLFWFGKVLILCQSSSADSQLVKSNVFQLKASKQIRRLEIFVCPKPINICQLQLCTHSFSCLLWLPYPCQIWTGKKKKNEHTHKLLCMLSFWHFHYSCERDTCCTQQPSQTHVNQLPSHYTSCFRSPLLQKNQDMNMSANSTHVFLRSTYSTLKQVKSCTCSIYSLCHLYELYKRYCKIIQAMQVSEATPDYFLDFLEKFNKNFWTSVISLKALFPIAHGKCYTK